MDKNQRILNNIALFRFIKNGNHDECVTDAVIVALNMWYAFNVHSIFRKCFTQQFELSARQIWCKPSEWESWMRRANVNCVYSRCVCKKYKLRSLCVMLRMTVAFFPCSIHCYRCCLTVCVLRVCVCSLFTVNSMEMIPLLASLPFNAPPK